MVDAVKRMPQARFLSVDHALTADGIVIECQQNVDVPLWIEALSPIRNFSKAPADNVFCHVTCSSLTEKSSSPDIQEFDASATPINNVWHAPFVGPMWSQVGTLHLKKGNNRLQISSLKSTAHIDRIYLGLWPPFDSEPRVRIPAAACHTSHDTAEGHITKVQGLGYTDGLLVQPFDTPSYDIKSAPYVEYTLNIESADHAVEIRTLPTLHVYEGRDARYAVQIGQNDPQTFSLHASDFTAEWRWNVLRGYASRWVTIPHDCHGQQRLRIYLLDPGIVIQEVLVH